MGWICLDCGKPDGEGHETHCRFADQVTSGLQDCCSARVPGHAPYCKTGYVSREDAIRADERNIMLKKFVTWLRTRADIREGQAKARGIFLDGRSDVEAYALALKCAADAVERGELDEKTMEGVI